MAPAIDRRSLHIRTGLRQRRAVTRQPPRTRSVRLTLSTLLAVAACLLAPAGSEAAIGLISATPVDGYAVDADASGRVLVLKPTTVGGTGIATFDPAGKPLLNVALGDGSGPGQLHFPSDIAGDPAGTVWVADTGNDRIVRLSPSGEFIASFGTSGSGPGQFRAPYRLALDATGNVFVSDTGNNRVQELGPDGTLIGQFGGTGSGPGQLLSPTGIDIAPNGNVYVTDMGNGRIEEFSPGGAFIRELAHFTAISLPPGEVTGVGSPGSLATTSDGDVLLQASGIERFTATGEPIEPAFTCVGPAGAQDIAADAVNGFWTVGIGKYGGRPPYYPGALSHFGDPGAPLDCKVLDIKAPKFQKLGKLGVTIKCPDQPCELTIRGRVYVDPNAPDRLPAQVHAKLRTIHLSLAADDQRKVRLKVSDRGDRATLERALAQSGPRGRGSADVKIQAAVDPANQTAFEQRTLKLKTTKAKLG